MLPKTPKVPSYYEGYRVLTKSYFGRMRALPSNSLRVLAMAHIARVSALPNDSQVHRRAVLEDLAREFELLPPRRRLPQFLTKRGFDYDAIMDCRLPPEDAEITMEDAMVAIEKAGELIPVEERSVVAEQPASVEKPKRSKTLDRFLKATSGFRKKPTIGVRLPKVRPYIKDIRSIPPGPKRTEFVAHICRLIAFNHRGEPILNGYDHRRRVLMAIHPIIDMRETEYWDTKKARLIKRGFDVDAILYFKIPKADLKLSYDEILQRARSENGST